MRHIEKYLLIIFFTFNNFLNPLQQKDFFKRATDEEKKLIKFERNNSAAFTAHYFLGVAALGAVSFGLFKILQYVYNRSSYMQHILNFIWHKMPASLKKFNYSNQTISSILKYSLLFMPLIIKTLAKTYHLPGHLKQLSGPIITFKPNYNDNLEKTMLLTGAYNFDHVFTRDVLPAITGNLYEPKNYNFSNKSVNYHNGFDNTTVFEWNNFISPSARKAIFTNRKIQEDFIDEFIKPDYKFILGHSYGGITALNILWHFCNDIRNNPNQATKKQKKLLEKLQEKEFYFQTFASPYNADDALEMKDLLEWLPNMYVIAVDNDLDSTANYDPLPQKTVNTKFIKNIIASTKDEKILNRILLLQLWKQKNSNKNTFESPNHNDIDPARSLMKYSPQLFKKLKDLSLSKEEQKEIIRLLYLL